MSESSIILIIACLALHVWAWHALRADMDKTNSDHLDLP